MQFASEFDLFPDNWVTDAPKHKLHFRRLRKSLECHCHDAHQCLRIKVFLPDSLTAMAMLFR